MSRRTRHTKRSCPVPGCPTLTLDGRCTEHRRSIERERGTTTQRGYSGQHQSRFRPQVLARDPICVLCHTRQSEHADHYPRSRRELEAAGEDPNDPKHGRGLCATCHNRETSHHQPGGWAANHS